MGFAEHDVVIVGGGHNGLACAAYLAKAGLDVLVLERRERARRRRGDRGTVARLPRLERVLRRVADAAADRARARPQAVRLRGLDHHARLLRAVPRRDVAHAVGRRSRATPRAIARFSPHDAERVRGVRPRTSSASPGLLKDLLFVVPPNLNLRDAPEVGDDRGPVPQVERSRRPRGRAPVHDERGRLPRRVVRGRAGEGRARDAGDHRRVVRADDAGLARTSSMHHWIGEIDGHSGAWGWVKGGMGGVSEAMARAAEAAGAEIRTGRRGRPRRDQRERPGGGRRARRTARWSARSAVVSSAHPTTTYLDRWSARSASRPTSSATSSGTGRARAR